MSEQTPQAEDDPWSLPDGSGGSVAGLVFDAARRGDVDVLAALLDAEPDMLHGRGGPYAATLLHAAARHERVVALLLSRGIDVNAREKGDNTYAMHWAAAAGALDVVRRLADAGGDIIGDGDDHGLGVIGWATCWHGCDDDAHRSVVEFLLSRGARHHIFSAIAMNFADEVRRIVANDPSALERRMSHNENFQRPLHFAVRIERPEMVALLVALGADPLAVDGDGYAAAAYANTPDVDRPVMEVIGGRALAQIGDARGSVRRPRIGLVELLALLSLGERDAAERVARDEPRLLRPDGAAFGALHLMAKRGDARGVEWLLDHGADPNARWDHWDASVTPLHLAASRGHVEAVHLLLGAGADPTIRDSKHDSDAIGWAEFFGQPAVAELLRRQADGG